MSDFIEMLPWHKKIKILRIIKEWTQQEAADNCSVDRRAYQMWEKGISKPHKNNRKMIASVFEIEEREIFGNE